MKKLILILFMLLCFLFIGCTDYVDLASERTITSKITYNDRVSAYKLNQAEWTSPDYIYADPNFAEKGDIIQSVNGVIKVIKKAKK